MGPEGFGEGGSQTVKKDFLSGLRKRQMMAQSHSLPPKAEVFGNTVYSPTAFARMLGFSRHELLEKESQGILPPAKRDESKDRYYTPEDIIRYRKYLGLPPIVRSVRKQLFLNFKGGTGKSTICPGFRIPKWDSDTIDWIPRSPDPMSGTEWRTVPKDVHALIEKEIDGFGQNRPFAARHSIQSQSFRGTRSFP
jgi:hypothetical protein